ncbi:MAG: hypothetical protein E7320_12325 [Clostridiales bacterium]|nr:hypothetical protein [Clostridiales bacterium]
MEAFVRQLVALAGLWALCELLLPEGRQQRMVHMAVSLMVMAALIGSLSSLAGQTPAVQWPVLALQNAMPVTGYDRIALKSTAEQAALLCSRTAQRAGYTASAVVRLHTDGSLAAVDMYLQRGGQPPLMAEDSLCGALAELLGAERERIRWSPGEEADP